MIVIASVMHTGTHLVKNLFNEGRIEQCHFTDKKMNKMNKLVAKANLIVVPLRHPARCLESFRRRGRAYGLYLQQWDNLIENPPKAYYVHIDDLDRRDADIARFEHLIHVPVDWNPSLASGAKRGTHNLEITNALLHDVPQDYIDFYMEEK